MVFQAARSKSSSRKAGNWREKALFYRIPPSRADVNQAHPARRSRGRQTTSGLSQRGFYGALFVMHGAAGDNKARVSQWNVLHSLQLRITIQKRIRERFWTAGLWLSQSGDCHMTLPYRGDRELEVEPGSLGAWEPGNLGHWECKQGQQAET